MRFEGFTVHLLLAIGEWRFVILLSRGQNFRRLKAFFAQLAWTFPCRLLHKPGK
jgi:hypothetical protein